MRRFAFLSFCVLVFISKALAQPYPAKPLRMIVPFPPGGVTDVMSRAVAARLSVELGQPVVVENRAGASGIIGAEAGAKSPADGYTITMGNISTLAVNAATFAKLPYDPVTSFAPISMVAIQPLLIAVHPSLPVQSLPELVSLAKAKPGQLSYGTAGSSIHLAVEYFSSAAGIRMNHIPYKGSSPAITDMIGGQLQVLFDPFSSLYPQVRAGKARGLAVTTEHRSSVAPELPTVSELGFKGFDVSSWQGLVVPAATPREVVDWLNRQTVKVLGSGEIREQFAKHGAEPAPTSPEKFGEYIRAEIARWQKVGRDAGVKPE